MDLAWDKPSALAVESFVFEGETLSKPAFRSARPQLSAHAPASFRS